VEYVQRKVQQLTAVQRLAVFAIAAGALLLPLSSCVNPFAPGRDETPGESSCDPHTIDGVFQCFRAAYSFRDTTLYGQLLDPNFVFVYRNYDLGIDVTWGRDDEMRTTYGLFQNAQKIDLIWNNIISSTTDSSRVTIVRGFNLTIVFNPSDVERIDGYANLIFERPRVSDPWRIVRWRDESNF
jgi:hypothetical protein